MLVPAKLQYGMELGVACLQYGPFSSADIYLSWLTHGSPQERQKGTFNKSM